MLVIGTFEHSIELEQALAVLEYSGIKRNHLLVIPMDTAPKCPMGNMGKSRDRYYKGIEVGMACATASAVIGISVGFVLTWGPIIWSLIFAIATFTIGFIIFILTNKDSHGHFPKRLPDVTVIVQCTEDQSTQVMETMWKFRVLTVGRILEPS